MRRHTLAIALSALILVPSGVALGQSPGPDISGQTINVLMPPWANLPQELLDEFTAETGVKLNYTVAEWDAIRDKIAVAGAAGSELADVTEFDWSWTGQYGRTGWFEPLEGRIDTSDMVNNGAFTLGDHLYGACYNNDYRIYLYNSKMFADAGIAEPPTTFDELLADARTLKEKGIVEYPLLFPLRAGEDTSMTWYLNVLAYGGQLVDANGQPQFEDPSSGGYQALKFYIDALANGLIDPAVTAFSSNGQLLDYFLSGKSAITYGAPSDLVSAEDPAASKVVGQIKPMLVPGVSGPGPSYGQPEALGVMSNSQHKDAALAFIDWWEKPETLLKIYDAAGLLPCRQGVLSTLQEEGKLAGGDVLLEELNHVSPLFPNGAPRGTASSVPRPPRSSTPRPRETSRSTTPSSRWPTRCAASPVHSRGATRSRQDHRGPARRPTPAGPRLYRPHDDRSGCRGAASRRDQRGTPGLAVRVTHPRAHRPARGLPAGPRAADERPARGHLPGRGDALRRSRQLRPAPGRARDGRGGPPYRGLLAGGRGRRGLPRPGGCPGPAPPLPRSWPRPCPARAALGAPAGRVGAPLDTHLDPSSGWLNGVLYSLGLIDDYQLWFTRPGSRSRSSRSCTPGACCRS